MSPVNWWTWIWSLGLGVSRHLKLCSPTAATSTLLPAEDLWVQNPWAAYSGGVDLTRLESLHLGLMAACLLSYWQSLLYGLFDPDTKIGDTNLSSKRLESLCLGLMAALPFVLPVEPPLWLLRPRHWNWRYKLKQQACINSIDIQTVKHCMATYPHPSPLN
jgi:hypothetical protein